MFSMFMELLIKLVLYHKREGLNVESCQFRNGNVYVIRISKQKNYNPKRILSINSKEINMLMEMVISSDDLWEKYIPVLKIMVRPKEKLINGIYESKSILIISSNYEASLDFGLVKRSISVRINRLEKFKGSLKGGLNMIHLKIYGSIIDLNVEE
jgi:hypothetical protein